MQRLLVVLAVGALIAGCAGKKPIAPPDQLWGEGNEAYDSEAYEYAVERYKSLLDQHPFDAHAEEAELKIGRAYYLSGRWAEAIAAASDFERMHPTSPNLPLVQYFQGMAYLAQASTADRDQQPINNALTVFRNLVDRFPTDPWAERARLRIQECRAQLARHEADVAGYYLRHGNLLAAEGRLRGLLTDYPDTNATAETLWTFAKAYDDRQQPAEAALARAVILVHHPDGPLAAKAGAELAPDAGTLGGRDPLPMLVARLQEMASLPDRHNVPATVSAYPNLPPGAPTGY